MNLLNEKYIIARWLILLLYYNTKFHDVILRYMRMIIGDENLQQQLKEYSFEAVETILRLILVLDYIEVLIKVK